MPTSSVLVRLLLPVLASLPAAAQVHLTLGVYSFKKPTEVVRDFATATDELARLMTKQCGTDVAIHLRVFKTYDECVDKFVAGEVDLVRFGPASYVIAKQRNPAIQLLVAEQEDGKKRCQGVIVVRQNSPIRNLADLRGRTFAFGDEMSTIGRYLSQAQLAAADVRQEDLAGCRYLERHDKVFKAVEVGDFDAGALHIATFEDMNEKGQLRAIAIFENVGKPWIARAGLAPELVTALRASLLELTDAASLKALKVHGFLPTSDADFQLVRDGIRSAEVFARPRKAPEPLPQPQPQPGRD